MQEQSLKPFASFVFASSHLLLSRVVLLQRANAKECSHISKKIQGKKQHCDLDKGLVRGRGGVPSHCFKCIVISCSILTVKDEEISNIFLYGVY